jgi:hypothetical protein
VGQDNIYFDTLELKVLSGSFSVEGGADGLVASPPPTAFPQRSSFLELVQPYEGLMKCVTSPDLAGVSSADEAAQQSGAGNEPYIRVTRLGNADESPCALVPYTLDNALKSVTFYKPLDQQGSAQFIVDMTWKIPANTDNTDAPLVPETSIDYESDNNPAAPVDIPLRWCPDLVVDPQGSGYKVVSGIGSRADLDQDGNLEGVQYACLISSNATDVDGSTVQLDQQMYLYGDARWSLP